MLAVSVNQVTPVSTKRSTKESSGHKILNILKASQEQNKKTLEQIDSTLAASSPDVKKSCCRWMDANVKEMEPSFWRFFQDQSVDQPVANRQSVTGWAEPQYILCNVPTGVFMS